MTKQEQFLDNCNGGARTRIFDESDYRNYQNAIRRAKRAQAARKPFYVESDAGSVANAYKYPTQTAQWCVYIEPENMLIIAQHGRANTCRGRVTKMYYGGERAYMKAWLDAREA